MAIFPNFGFDLTGGTPSVIFSAASTSISSLSLDTEIPTAKAVYDYAVSGQSPTYQYITSGSSGIYSIKANNDTTTNATGNYAFAFGNNCLASNNYSFAGGYASSGTGEYSIALGSNSVSSGDYSCSIGKGTKSYGENSVSFGNGSMSYGTGSFAFGLDSKSYGTNSFAFGRRAISSGTCAFNFSYNSSLIIAGLGAIGDYSAVLGGKNCRASGEGSVVIGGDGLTGATAYTTYVQNLNIATQKTGTPAYEITADASGNILFGESSEDLIYSTRIIVLSGDLLTSYSVPITAATINITTDQYIYPVECEVYFSGGTTNYSESSRNYSFETSLVGENTISSSVIGSISSFYSGERSFSFEDSFSKTNIGSGNNFYNIIVSSTSFFGDPDAGDRSLIIDFRYKIKTIPSF